MEPVTYSFSLSSNTFAHGAYQTQNFNRPELRAPSVKGMLRWWHEALGYSPSDARAIFGQVANRREGIDGNQASRVVIRVQPTSRVLTQPADFIPHKGRRGGTKDAIQPGVSYALSLLPRRGELPSELWKQVLHAAEAWLLLGAIGQRSNRAAGSIIWDRAPTTQREFEIRATEILGSAKIRFAVLEPVFRDEQDARKVAGDFLKDEAFGGFAPFGSARPRKPSPMKLKCLRLDGGLRLLAVWDHRKESMNQLTRGIGTLCGSNKEIGQLLRECLPKFEG